MDQILFQHFEFDFCISTILSLVKKSNRIILPQLLLPFAHDKYFIEILAGQNNCDGKTVYMVHCEMILDLYLYVSSRHTIRFTIEERHKKKVVHTILYLSFYVFLVRPI